MAAANLSSVILLLLLTRIMGHPREILVDDENPSMNVDALHIEEDEETYDKEEMPCHMQYQVMKRVVGTCIKLGKNTRACVAGNYLHPLHPECM